MAFDASELTYHIYVKDRATGRWWHTGQTVRASSAKEAAKRFQEKSGHLFKGQKVKAQKNPKRRKSKAVSQKTRAALKTIGQRAKSLWGGKRKRSRKTHGFTLQDARREKNPMLSEWTPAKVRMVGGKTQVMFTGKQAAQVAAKLGRR